MPTRKFPMDKNKVQNLIKELISKMSIGVAGVLIEDQNSLFSHSGSDKTTWFSIEVDQPHFFLDRGGEALFALNHLVKKMVEDRDDKSPDLTQENKEEIMIDINGFQKKRIENIHAIAHMMAERARYFKSNIEVDPMSPFERRIVHEFLSDATDLKTESQGEGPNRRVVIKYIGSI